LAFDNILGEYQVENTPQLQLEELLFPLQEVRSNQAHDVNGDRAGTQLDFGQQIQKMEGQPGRYVLMVSVKTNNETSKNPPYQFAIEAYAVLSVKGAADEAAEQLMITSNGFPMIMGAIRERLAQLTSRAPWGRFLVNSIPLNPVAQISYL
jgi:preprotein translocase subunit SecB